MRRLKKNVYLGLCGTLVAALSVVRACTRESDTNACSVQSSSTSEAAKPMTKFMVQSEEPASVQSVAQSNPNRQHPVAYHPIRGVYNYHACFPDSQNVQIAAARRWGVRPVRDRRQAEQRKGELVFIGSSPYFVIDRGMSHSIPYLVPRAALLLQDIGRNYLDSLHIKGVPLHRIIVTSVTRTRDDVKRLSRQNVNATENSCHCYGTTIDITYTRYDKPDEHAANDDKLRSLLMQTVYDLREAGRCYVKYERKQACLHITVR